MYRIEFLNEHENILYADTFDTLKELEETHGEMIRNDELIRRYNHNWIRSYEIMQDGTLKPLYNYTHRLYTKKEQSDLDFLASIPEYKEKKKNKGLLFILIFVLCLPLSVFYAIAKEK